MEKLTKEQERLQLAAKSLKECTPEQKEILKDTTVEDIAKMLAAANVRADEYKKVISVLIYIKFRVIEGLSKEKAFRKAFPERCVVQEGDEKKKEVTTFKCGKPGDPVSKSSIIVKANRLEESNLYQTIFGLMQMNVYTMFAVERVKVISAALDVALDEDTPLRDRDRYMKLFLEETRKPEEAKQLEFNINITQNNISVMDMEDKLNQMAKQLEGKSAKEIIDVSVVKDDSSKV